MVEDYLMRNAEPVETVCQSPIDMSSHGYPIIIPFLPEQEKAANTSGQTKRQDYRDLLGMRIGRLLVFEKLPKRDRKGCVIWKCVCDCGNTCEYSMDQLINHKIVSCGCYRTNVLKHNLNNGLHRMQGMCLERLCITKARPDSKSGVVGIHITTNGYYRASIGFQGKRYNLGMFENIEDAIKARKHAEKIHRDFLENHCVLDQKKIEFSE